MAAADSLLGQFIEHQRKQGVNLPPATAGNAFEAVHHWSIGEPADFWSAVWQDSGVIADRRADGTQWDSVVHGIDRMAPPDAHLGPTWFTGARLNYSENLLRHEGTEPALIAWDERGRVGELSWDSLRSEVARTAAGLRALDVQPGDRVAGWLPNIPETIVAMLAAASIGAVWTSCSPDFGVDGVVDRFGQTGPVVLICCDGYGYGGKVHDSVGKLPSLLSKLPSVRHAVVIPYRGGSPIPDDPRVISWEKLRADVAAPLHFTRLPFDHPLAVLYSSGTTGLPKCMVHGAGGTLLQHLKEHRLHGDLRAGERIFYFTTCGWMMWNWLVGALAAGATLVLYDGAPLPASDPGMLWRLAAAERVNVFGTSAKYLALAEKHELEPGAAFDLASLRSILSTGSPLSPESFDWIARAVNPAVRVASISGGTDIVSCFVLGNPLQPVHRGEIQGPGLGMAVAVFDELGRECPIGEAGELVCTRPFPSMPVCFWNDPDGEQYRAAYFSTWPGVWRHGDWITRTPSGGYVISGRSDATLNPGGVRIGTAEIYRQVEAIPEVLESVVIGQRIPGALDGDVRVVLFVKMRSGESLTPALEEAIRRQVRIGASPHHVPRVILEVFDIPRTRSGKLSELAVRDTVEGRPVKNVGALANPEA
ncbi:MAG: acetoacetate--CoA ligase, partial [Gemmatimonadales bacterium]